jgi:hypothetical protein
MAATAITTTMAGAVQYTYTTDSSADWGLVPINTFFFDKTEKIVYYKDSNSMVGLPYNPTIDNYLFSSSQWSVTAPATPLPSGASANGWNFFTDGANKVTAGTTAYDEYFIYAGRFLTLTGTSGTANINILGVNYGATFSTNLSITAATFVAVHGATLNALGIQVFANAGILRFGKQSDLAGGSVDLSAITITTTSGTLSGTFNTTTNDHLVIPYSGKPYFGLRLNHVIRVNFNINTGAIQYGELSLRRWADDSQIGSAILVQRNTQVTGQQYVFISYTASSLDPFVTGGFYFQLTNQDASTWTISGAAGILIESVYQKPLNF